MLRSVTTTLAAALALATPLAGAQIVLPKGSEIGFVTRQMGVPVQGRFTKWQAELSFDPQQPAAGKVAFTIDTGSASFGAAETDAEVVKPDWFHVAKFPQATFNSTAIKPAGAGRYEVAGKLAIKGQTRDIVVPVALSGNTATGSFTIKRLDFGIGAGDWADPSLVANDVQVNFKLSLSGLKP